MNSKRLELALERLASADWERFERFASEFLVSEFPDLKTVASPSEDAGRDAELFSPTGETTQVLQYSVAEDWKAKIRKTATRISETLPTTQQLIYVTNQVIGAEADGLKKEIRTAYKFHLDIKDRSYFLERYRREAQTEAAAEALAEAIVDPYLRSREVLSRRPSALDNDEMTAAHVYLSLQLRDDAQQKGLTKLAFEALVRSALSHTNSERRMPRSEVKRRIRELLPSDAHERIDQLTDSALSRLTKRAVRHWPLVDEYCLTHEETQRVSEYVATQDLSETTLLDEIQKAISGCVPDDGWPPADVAATTVRIRRILERCLYQRAESFACTVLEGSMAGFETDHLKTTIIDDLRSAPPPKGDLQGNPEWLATVVRGLLGNPGQATQLYMRDLADACTLLAFLRQTPDVQRAVHKMFSYGEIWLDTSAILPLFAEEAFDDQKRQFQEMFAICREAGINFFVTSGVVEELDRHMHRAMQCARSIGTWKGQLPFLLEAFLQTGQDVAAFASWTDLFRGPNRPIDDIFEFLQERFGIERRDLEAKANEAPEDLRLAVQEAWYRIHEKRRERLGMPAEPVVINRLSRHDTENYVGVIQQRKEETPSPFGYSAWWLTLDRAAFSLCEALKRDIPAPPDSPILTVDFLAQYLTLGPVRSRVSKASLIALPVVLEPRLVRFLTGELLDEAARIRNEMKGAPERLFAVAFATASMRRDAAKVH